MMQSGRYTFKRADRACEFDQVHALNHSTFVREIPQHEDSGDGRLVDKFHEKNVYFIALRDERVVGMISIHDQRPFSVAGRLPDPRVLESPGMRPLEIRLLAIPAWRAPRSRIRWTALARLPARPAGGLHRSVHFGIRRPFEPLHATRI